MIDPLTGLPQVTRTKSSNPIPVNPGMKPTPTQGYTLPDRLDRYDFRFTPGIDMNEMRAQTQTGLFAKGVGRLVTGAGFELAKSIPYLTGAVASGVAAIAGAEDPLSYMVDNQLLNWINEQQNAFNEDVMPIYQTMAAQSGSLTERLFEPTFWATQGADAGAFFLSMIVPGRAVASLGLGSKLVTGAGRAAKLLKPTFQTSAKAMKFADDFAATMTNTVIESAAEASNFFTNTRDQLMADGYNMEEASNIAGANAAGVFAMNMGILSVSNFVFDALLFKSFDNFLNIGNKSAMNQIGKDVADMANPLRTNLAKAALGKATIGLASEGFYEEGSQYAVEKYFEARANQLTDEGPIEGMFTEYFSRIAEDADMQAGIFLGGLLGTLSGAVGGVTDELNERARWEGTSGTDPNSISGRLRKKMGLTPKKAHGGLRQLIADNYINHTKSVSDFYKKDADGKLILDEDNQPIFDEDLLSEMDLKQKGLLAQLMNMNAALANGDKEAYEIQKSFLDFNFMLPYFEVPGGMEVLQSHLQQKAESDVARMKEENPDFDVSSKTMLEGLLKDAQEYKKIYDRINNTHRVNFKIKNAKEPEKFEQFSRLVYENKISNGVKEYGYKKAIASMNETLKSLDENTADGKANIPVLEKKIETLKKAQEKFTTKALDLYDYRKINSLYNRFTNNKIKLDEVDLYDVLEGPDGKIYELTDKLYDPLYQNVSFELTDPDTGVVKSIEDIGEYKVIGNAQSDADTREEKSITDEEQEKLLTEYEKLLEDGDPVAAAEFYNKNIANNKIKLSKDKLNEYYNLVQTKLDSMNEFDEMIKFIDEIKKHTQSYSFKKRLDKMRDTKINELKQQRVNQIKALEDLIKTKESDKKALEESITKIEKSIEELNESIELLASKSRAAVRDLYNKTALDKRTKEFKQEVKEVEDKFNQQIQAVRDKIEDLKAQNEASKKTIANIEQDILQTEQFKKWVANLKTYRDLRDYVERMKAEYHTRTQAQQIDAQELAEEEGIPDDFEKLFDKDFLEKAIAEKRKTTEQMDEYLSQVSDTLDDLTRQFNELLAEYYKTTDEVTAANLEEKLTQLTGIIEEAERILKKYRSESAKIRDKSAKLKDLLATADRLGQLERGINSISNVITNLRENVKARRKDPKVEIPDVEVVRDLDRSESAKRGYRTLFTGLGGRHFEYDNTLTPIDSLRRYFYFLQTNKVTDYQVQIVREKDYPQLFNEQQREMFKSAPDEVKAHEILIAIVLDKDGNYVDMNGQPLADQKTIDPSTAVYSALKVPKKLIITDESKGTTNFDNDVHQKAGLSNSQHWDNIQAQIDWYTKVRESIIAELEAGGSVILPLQGKSRGIRVIDKDENGEPINHPVSQLGIDIHSPDVDVVIPVEDGKPTITNANQVIEGLRGMLLIEDELGNVHRGYIRNLNENEIETAYQLLKLVASNKDYASEVVPGITLKEGLQSLMYYGYNKNGNSPIYVQKNPDGTKVLVVGKERIPFMLNQDGELANAQRIREVLSERYINAKSSIINDDSNKSGIYRQIEYINGEFIGTPFDSYNSLRQNYLEYLFDGEDPIVGIPTPIMDGKAETVQFKSQYAIVDFEAHISDTGNPVPEQPGFDLSSKEKPVGKSKQIDNVVKVLSGLIESDKAFEERNSPDTFFDGFEEDGLMIGIDAEGQVFVFDKNTNKTVSVLTYNAKTNKVSNMMDAEGKDTTLTLQETFETYGELRKEGGEVLFLKLVDKKESKPQQKKESKSDNKSGDKSSNPEKERLANEKMAALRAKKSGQTTSNKTNNKNQSAQSQANKKSSSGQSSNKTSEAEANEKLRKLRERQKKGGSSSSNRSNRSGRSSKLRMATTERPVELENVPEMLQWFRQKFPHVPINVAHQLISNKGWGAFVDNAVVLYNFAGKGTTYHESFHVVFNLYMSPKERANMIALYRQKHKVGDEIDDWDIEELMADEFMDYMLTGETPAIPEQRSFFRRLWDMIKSLFAGKSLKEQKQVRDLSDLYEYIKTNKFTEKPRYDYQGAIKYKSVGDLTIAETNDLMNGLTFIFFDELAYEIGDEASIMARLIRGERVTDSNLLPSLFNPNSEDNLLERALNLASDEQFFQNTPEQTDRLYELLENLSQNHLTEVLNMFRERLERIGIKVEVEEMDEFNEEEVVGYSQDTKYDQIAIEVSGKSTASSLLKKLLASFRKMTDDNQFSKNSLGMFEVEDFGRMYALLSNRLANLDNLQDILTFIEENDHNLNYIWPQLKKRINLVDFQNAPAEDVITAMQIFQAFAKQRVNYNVTLVDYKNTNDTDQGPRYKTIDASDDYAARKIARRWHENAHVNDIYILEDGAYKYDLAKLKPYLDATDTSVKSKDWNRLAKMLGIELTVHDNGNVPLTREIIKILGFIKTQIKNGTLTNLFDRETEAEGNLKRLLDIEMETAKDFFENQHFNNDNKTVYDISLNTYMSIIINKLNRSKTKEEMLNSLPYYNDTYLRNNLTFDRIFKKDGNRGIKLTIHESINSNSGNLNRSFRQMNKAEKFHMMVNDTLQGEFHMLRTADNSLERTLSIGELYFEDPLSHGKVSDQVVNAYIGYLADEIETNHIDIYDNFTKNSVLNPLTIFDFLTGNAKEQVDLVIKKLDDNPSTNVVNELNTPEIREGIRDFITQEIEENIKLFEQYKFVVPAGNGYTNVSLPINKRTLSAEDLRTVAARFTVNLMTANIEQTKLFTGHPAFYKSVADFFKRTSALVGTKKLTDSSPLVNNWIKEHLPRTDKKTPNGKMNVYVVDDVSFKSNNTTLPAYAAYSGDESDAGGFITLDEYREFLFKTGDWYPEMEMIYLYENGIKVVPDDYPFESIRGNIIDPSVFGTGKYVLPPLKPQYFGPLAVQNAFVPGMYKLSMMPLIPSMIKGTNLETINQQMKENQIGLLTFKSANKVGRKRLSDDSTAELYDEDGNLRPLNPKNIQESLYDYWGIQVDNAPKRKSSSSEGTQQKKQHKTDLYERGKAALFNAFKYTYNKAKNAFDVSKHDPKTAARDLDREYNILNRERILLGVELLKRRIGWSDNEQGLDYSLMVESLKKEAIARDMPENIISSIESLALGFGVEASPAREKLENVIFAIAEKETVSRKRFGAGLVQVPVTGFESVQRVRLGKEFYSSDTLEFYTNKDGQITSMEVYLPNIFKETVFKDIPLDQIDARLLEFIGFRIPTQGLSSIDHIKIKGFLPAWAGDVIIMPSEIVVKNGSDFDFDKLFTLFPNFTWEKGQPVYTEYITDPKKFDELFKRRKNQIIKEFGLDKGSLAPLMNELERYRKMNSATTISINELRSTAKLLKTLADKSAMQGIINNEIQIQVIKDALEDLNEVYDQGVFLNDDELDSVLQEYEDNQYTNERIKELERENKELKAATDLGIKPEEVNTLIKEATEEFKKLLTNKLLIRSEINQLKNEITTKAKEVFDNLSVPMKNGIKAMENRMNEIQKEIILAPDNFKRLTSPLVDSDVKREAYRIKWILSGSELDFDTWFKNKSEDTSYTNLLRASYLTDLQEQFLNANAGIGISALQQTNHILATIHDLYIRPQFQVVRGGKAHQIDTKINLNHNRDENGNILLGMRQNQEGVFISELLNQMTSAYVDAAKDPFVFLLNAGTETAPTFLYLLRAGVPLRELVLFMNQPIIKDYLFERSIYESVYWDRFAAGDSKLRRGREQILAEVAGNYGGVQASSPKYDLNTLEQSIKDRDNLTDAQKREQVSYLNDFIRYMETARALSKSINATTYDTRGFGKNANALYLMLKSSYEVQKEGAVGNFDKLLLNPDSFLSPYYLSALRMLDVFSGYINSMKHPEVRDDMMYIISTMSQAGKSNEQIIKVLDRYKSELMTYTLHRNPTINTRVEELFTGKKSLPRRVAQLKKMMARNGESNALLNYIEAVFTPATDSKGNPYSAHDFLKPRSSARIDTDVANEITEGWEELLQNYPDIGEDLVDFVILQSGMTRSPMNFIEYMPNRLFVEKISPYLEDFSVDNFYERFKLDAQMVRDNDVVPDRRFNKAHAKADPINKTIERTYSETTGRVIKETTSPQVNEKHVQERGIADFRNNRQLKDYSSPDQATFQRGEYDANFNMFPKDTGSSAVVANVGTEAGEISIDFVVEAGAEQLSKILNQMGVDINKLEINGLVTATPQERETANKIIEEIKNAC